MIFLTSDNSLQVVTSGTALIHGYASYIDAQVSDGKSVGMGAQELSVASATSSNVLDAPAEGNLRNCVGFTLRNCDPTVANTLTVFIDTPAGARELFKVALAAGRTLQYTEAQGFTVLSGLTALPLLLLAHSTEPVTAPLDTAENTLVSIPIPANTMGRNGALRLKFTVENGSGTGTRTVRVKFAAAPTTYFLAYAAATALAITPFEVVIGNANNTALQKGSVSNLNTSNGFNASGTGVQTTVDTTLDQTLLITLQKTTGASAAMIRHYALELLRMENT